MQSSHGNKLSYNQTSTRARLRRQHGGLGEGVEVAQRKGQRDRLLHVDGHILLWLVHVAVRPAPQEHARMMRPRKAARLA